MYYHPIVELSDVNKHPICSYFKSEYKSDWQYEYLKFIDSRRPTLKSVLRNAKNAMYRLFPNESSQVEREVANCKTLAEVDNVLKNRERNQMNQKTMLQKGIYSNLAS